MGMGWYEEQEGREPGVLGGYGGGPVQGGSGGMPTSGDLGSTVAKYLNNPYVNMGLGGLGGFLGARAHNQPEQWRQGVVNSEIARRNQMQSLALPGMMRAQGYTPGMINAMGSMGGVLGGGGGGGLNLNSQPSMVGKIAGTAGSAAGYLLGGPLGSMVGGALGSIGSAIGRGRRAANPLVDQVENPFGQSLAKVSSLAGTDPASAKMLLQQAYSKYMNGINQARAMGGKHKLVAEQSLSNPQLQSTYQALAKQLGVTL